MAELEEMLNAEVVGGKPARYRVAVWYSGEWWVLDGGKSCTTEDEAANLRDKYVREDRAAGRFVRQYAVVKREWEVV